MAIFINIGPAVPKTVLKEIEKCNYVEISSGNYFVISDKTARDWNEFIFSMVSQIKPKTIEHSYFLCETDRLIGLVGDEKYKKLHEMNEEINPTKQESPVKTLFDRMELAE